MKQNLTLKQSYLNGKINSHVIIETYFGKKKQKLSLKFMLRQVR